MTNQTLVALLKEIQGAALQVSCADRYVAFVHYDGNVQSLLIQVHRSCRPHFIEGKSPPLLWSDEVWLDLDDNPQARLETMLRRLSNFLETVTEQAV